MDSILSPVAAPTASPLLLTGSARDSNSITLSWAPPLLSERNGVIQHYLVNVTEVDTGNVYGHVALTTNFTLFALHPYYTYSTIVTAVTVSTGPPTSPVVITTHEDGEYKFSIYPETPSTAWPEVFECICLLSQQMKGSSLNPYIVATCRSNIEVNSPDQLHVSTDSHVCA